MDGKLSAENYQGTHHDYEYCIIVRAGVEIVDHFRQIRAADDSFFLNIYGGLILSCTPTTRVVLTCFRCPARIP